MDKTVMIESLVNYFTDGNKAKFANSLGISPQTLSKWVSRSTFDAELIYSKFPQVSAEWLLTGNGDMLVNQREQSGVSVTGSHNQVNGDGAHDNNNGSVDVAVLQERIKAMQQLLDEKERTIKILMGK